MTTNKKYKMINSNLTDQEGLVYYLIQRDDGYNIGQVYGKHTAKALLNELNNLSNENMILESSNLEYEDALGRLEEENIKLTEALTQYKEKVNQVFEDYYENYLQMACEVRHNKYASGTFHATVETIVEIADKLGVELENE